MTRTQAERKAMELYPDADSRADFYHGYQRETELERAAFMQCFDLMPTGSLPMTREEAKLKAHQFANDEKIFNLPPVMLTHKVALRAALKMYDHLASLSSAPPAPMTYEDFLSPVLDPQAAFIEKVYGVAHAGGMEYEKKDFIHFIHTHFPKAEKASPDREDEVKKRIIEALTERRDRLRYSVARYPADTEELEEKDRMRIEIFTDVIKELNETWPATPSAPAPVGVTREDAKQQAKKIATENQGVISGINKEMYDAALAMFDYLQGTAPVSSAAQPATGYSEDQVREAIRLAHQLNGYRAIKFTPDEIISSLNKKP
jgi:hypothetical protein